MKRKEVRFLEEERRICCQYQWKMGGRVKM